MAITSNSVVIQTIYLQIMNNLQIQSKGEVKGEKFKD